MLLSQAFEIPGEHLLELPGEIGLLQACLTVPTHLSHQYVAILGHPHSLQGGTMSNKVVTTLARLFKELGIASLRFNFRGVGTSFGTYDAGIGESADMCAVARLCLDVLPNAACLFAGFSFGSYVAYRAAAQFGSKLLITVAPPVHHYDYTEFKPNPAPWIVAQGDLDEVVPLALVVDFAKQQSLSLIRLPDATHFFHGQLLLLKQRLMDAIQLEKHT